MSTDPTLGVIEAETERREYEENLGYLEFELHKRLDEILLSEECRKESLVEFVLDRTRFFYWKGVKAADVLARDRE